MKLRYYQQAAVESVRAQWGNCTSTAVVACTGSGKCLGKGTPVLMFDGTIKPVESIKTGDLLIGPDSKPRIVLSTCVGYERLWRVVPVKGDPYVVNESHILSLKLTPRNSGESHIIANISVKEYLAQGNGFKHLAKGWRTGVEWEDKPLPLEPYFLGLWIGDGRSDSPVICKPDQEIGAYLSSLAIKYHLQLVKYEQFGKCPSWSLSGVPNRWHPNPITEKLRDISILNNKHIPHAYLCNSRENRLSLLAGLIDSDGHLMKGGGYEFSSTSEVISQQVAFLARSLGFAAYVTSRTTKCQTGASCLSYRVSISGNLEAVPCLIERKKHSDRKQIKDVLVTGISLYPHGEGEYFGFTLDGDGLFLLGDFTVTHNTECYLKLAVDEPGRTLVLVHRDYLIQQPIDRLAMVGFHDVAVEKAEEYADMGLRRARVVFASVQTIGPKSQQSRLESLDPMEFSQVIVDEAHRGTASTYRRVLDHFRKNPKCKILLLTATPKRKDGIGLHNVCQSTAFVYGPSQAMAEGWIVPTQFFKREVKSLDFSAVKKKGVDLDQEAMDKLMAEEGPLHEVCASLSEDRGPTIVFVPGVQVGHAYELLINSRYRPGKAKMIHGDTPDTVREDAGKALAQGDLDYLINCGIYTEGYDLPALLRVVWAAPTASLIKYTQGVGRVFRPHSSLRGQLDAIPTLEDAPRRRELIERSPKPSGIVVTYYPQNCKHELCDPIDILGGDNLPADVTHAAKLIQDETSKLPGGSNTDEDIETAKVFVEFRSLLDQRLKEIKATAQYTDSEFDPMSRRQQRGTNLGTAPSRASAASVVTSWGQTEPATERQRNWLLWKGLPKADVDLFTKWRASVVRDLVELGCSVEKASSFGKGQALKVRNEMQKKKENVNDVQNRS